MGAITQPMRKYAKLVQTYYDRQSPGNYESATDVWDTQLSAEDKRIYMGLAAWQMRELEKL